MIIFDVARLHTTYEAIHIAHDGRYTTLHLRFRVENKKTKNIATTDDEESKACSFRSLLGGREALTNGIEGEGMLRVKLEIISKLFAFWTEVCMHIYIYIYVFQFVLF